VNHQDHVNLLREGVPSLDVQVWADLGSGGGAFTLALADLLGLTSRIYSIDKNAGALRDQERPMRTQFPAVTVEYRAADFTKPLALPPLDGIVMANSLHFIANQQKPSVLALVKSYLKPGGRLILVEYNVDQGNFAVPYPFSYHTWEGLAKRSGFASTRLLMLRPSRFLGEIYSAVSEIS
jgi:ubiquinone/menaquinone biosynthesis C-methylase UbiE